MDEITLDEIIPTEITPPVNGGATTEQKEIIKVLLENGISTRDVFIDYNFPLEWAVEVENEIKAINTPVETPIENI